VKLPRISRFSPCLFPQLYKFSRALALRLTCASNHRLLWLCRRLLKLILCLCLRTPTWLPFMLSVRRLVYIVVADDSSCPRHTGVTMYVAQLVKVEPHLLIVYLFTPANPKISRWRGASGVKDPDLSFLLISYSCSIRFVSNLGAFNFTLCFVHLDCCDNFFILLRCRALVKSHIYILLALESTDQREG
jgi:hypothetical protein